MNNIKALSVEVNERLAHGRPSNSSSSPTGDQAPFGLMGDDMVFSQ